MNDKNDRLWSTMSMGYRVFTIGLLGVFLFIEKTQEVSAKPYLHGNFSTAISTASETRYYGALGATAGYQFNSFFSTEISYSRLIPFGSGSQFNLANLRVIAQLPLWVVTPYASTGPALQWSPRRFAYVIGAGVAASIFGVVNASVGIDYIYVNNAPDLVVPSLGLGFGF